MNIYVGPYVRCTIIKMPVVMFRKACPNTQCPGHRHVPIGAFCYHCGSQIADQAETVMRDLDQGELGELLGETLSKPFAEGYPYWKAVHGDHIWLPNVSYKGEPEPLTDYEFKIISPNKDQEIASFKVAFADQLALLEQKYVSVSVEWGIIQES